MGANLRLVVSSAAAIVEGLTDRWPAATTERIISDPRLNADHVDHIDQLHSLAGTIIEQLYRYPYAQELKASAIQAWRLFVCVRSQAELMNRASVAVQLTRRCLPQHFARRLEQLVVTPRSV